MSIAIAHPNIALVKYWGKRDIALNLPAVSSVSLTLAPFATRTEVQFGAVQDEFHLDGQPAGAGEAHRIAKTLDLVVPGRSPAVVVTANDFPTGAGLASSASGFAALVVAAATAAGLPEDRTAWSRIARQGSGSACRSLFGGFAHWNRGVDPAGTDSVAQPLPDGDGWDVAMVVAITSTERKATSSTDGMERSRMTSPLYTTFVEQSEGDVAEAIAAIGRRDLERLGTVMESSTFKMHAVMATSQPPLIYALPATIALQHAVLDLRRSGVGAWMTMDAGPQVKVLCTASDAAKVLAALQPLASRVVIGRPGAAAAPC